MRGKGKIKFLCSTNFQLLSVRKNTGEGGNYLYIYIYIYIFKNWQLNLKWCVLFEFSTLNIVLGVL